MKPHIVENIKRGDDLSKYLILCIGLFVFIAPCTALGDSKDFFNRIGGSSEYSPFAYELPTLPSYCTCKLNKEERNSAKCAKMKGKFERLGDRGKDYIHAHHYCSGLLMLSRLSRGVGQRSALLAVAEQQFKYVITNSSKRFILMPEVLLNMGKTKKLMGKNSEASKYFYESIQLKKNYVQAYSLLADLYIENKDYKNALSIVQRGLKFSPNSPILKQKLNQLQTYMK